MKAVSRRGFLGMLGAAVVASAVPWPASLPLPVPPAPALAFRASAFSEMGVSMRYIQHYDAKVGPITRFDVLYGFSDGERVQVGVREA